LKAGAGFGIGISIAVAAIISFASILTAVSSQPSIGTGNDDDVKPDDGPSIAAAKEDDDDGGSAISPMPEEKSPSLKSLQGKTRAQKQTTVGASSLKK
jgi:hypothetical protein